MKKRDLTKGDIKKSLLVVAIPTILNMLLLFSYNIIDMYYVGQLSEMSVAAVGTAALFLNFGMAVSPIGVNGVAIKLTQSLGADDDESFKKYFSTGIYINIALSIVVFSTLHFFSNGLLNLLNIENDELYKLSNLYLSSYAFVYLISFFNMFFNRVMGSLGKSDVALKVNATGVILNIILDPIFIFTFDMGLRGAVIASFIGTFVNFAIYIYIFRKTLKETITTIPKKIYMINSIKLGYPYMLQRVLFTFIGLGMGKIILDYSPRAIAAQKIGFQIETVTLMVIGGTLQALVAFTGQNFGAKNYDRIKEAYSIAIKLGLIYASFTSVIFFIYGGEIVKLFATEAETIYYGHIYLKVIAIGQLFGVLEMISNGLYSGIGKPKIPTTISMAITPFRLVLAPLLGSYYGVEGVFYSILITTIAKGLISFGYYHLKIKNEIGLTIVK